LYKKVISGKPYWYLREMARVDGKPKMVSERYLGTAAEIEALLDAREASVLPDRTRHLDYGAVAAVWGLLTDLDVAGLIDQHVPAVPGLPVSAGTYLALAVANRVADPCSKSVFADWWKTTAGDRFTKIGANALDPRRFWDAMHAVPAGALAEIEHQLAVRVCERFELDTSSVALDLTNFATFITTGNTNAPIAARGKAKQKRTDLRLVGLGLVVTRDGGIPLLSHTYPGDRPDITQFPTMIKTLAARHADLVAAAGRPGTGMTVVFDAGQNYNANFAELAAIGLRYVGSVPASDCPDLLARPAKTLRRVPGNPGLTAIDTRRTVYGTDRRAILTHSEEPHTAQVTGFEGTTLAKVARKHILITDHDDWSIADVVAGYRSQFDAEFTFRQLKDRQVVSFSPMHHWSEHNIRVHTFTCVLALQIAHLMRLQTDRTGLHLSVRELLDQLAGIGETVLIYPTGGRGRPKARHVLTETTELQDQLTQIFHLDRHAPKR
jgi:transposase